MEDNNLMLSNSLWKDNSKITNNKLQIGQQQQEGQQLVPNQQQNQQELQREQQDVKKKMKRKKRKHEMDGLMIKVNVSLIYGMKNKIFCTLPDVIKLGVASKFK